MTTAAVTIWNRACLEQGGAQPRAGDRALASVLLFHGLAMNGGVLHAMETLSSEDFADAMSGFRFLGLIDIASSLAEVCSRFTPELRDPDSDDREEEAEALEEEADRSYGVDDATIQRAFERVLAAQPDLFAPL